MSSLSFSDTARARLLTALLLLVVFAAIPGALQFLDRGYFWQVANTALIFALLAASMHLVTGVAGLLQLGHAAFYGVGAYTAALLASRAGAPMALTLPAAGLVTAIVALLVALPTMRLVSIYFAVATLGIGQMLYLLMLNWVDLTRGPLGVMLFGEQSLLGIDLASPLRRYLLVAAITAASIWVIARLSHSYYGNALRALREDDQCADAMGIDTIRLKIESFAISGFFAGLAGALWAHTAGYISPPDFGFTQSILVLAMVVVGGLGSLPGAVVGALILILLPELLRPLGDIRNLLVGFVLFGVILFLPKGLIGEVSALDIARRQFAGAWRRGAGGGLGWR
ncbi:Branched-chain amino acid ABC transporter permease [Rhodovastum atsumiense]|nr:Branched-chain amino acid ABC transporter permease [Rhodovastum atsumiense]